MARVKHAVAKRRRHKRTLKAAKGAWGRRSKLFRRAKETVTRGMAFSTRDRKNRKRAFRSLWITRLHAACEAENVRYNRFVAGLKAARVELDRKVLADLAVSDPSAFRQIVEVAKRAKAPAAA